MKELSIEEKAKAYDEALERASKLRFQNPFDTVSQMVEHVFPELAESEDDKIKEEIKVILANTDLSQFALDHTFSDMISWLEKQGQQKYIPKYKIGDYVKNTNYKGEPIYEIIYMDKECYICEYRGKEKMGDKAVMHFSFDNPYLRLAQKPADKVEPKFHEGDWVVYKNDICQIVKREEGCNKLVTVFGIEKELVNERNLSTAHLWTIKDAKDGDVLAWDDSKCIALFKNIYDEDSFNSYGFVGHCTGTFESRLSYHDIEGAHPATKEQRDHLFAKMKEAGYEWSDKDRKLIKIVK